MRELAVLGKRIYYCTPLRERTAMTEGVGIYTLLKNTQKVKWLRTGNPCLCTDMPP